MSEIPTTGGWKPNPGSEEAFVEASEQFPAWASGRPGAGRLRLERDPREPGRLVSFGAWESIEAVRDWKSSPELRERMAHVLQHVAEFQPSELALVATAEAGATTTDAPVGIA